MYREPIFELLDTFFVHFIHKKHSKRRNFTENNNCTQRVNKEHRLIYEVDGEIIKIHSTRGHYF